MFCSSTLLQLCPGTETVIRRSIIPRLFTIFKEKQLYWSLILIKRLSLLKETLTKVFSRK